MSGDLAEDGWAGRNAVFVSYARDDSEWMQAFQVMLSPVLDELGIQLWVDSEIRTGTEWSLEVERAIARSGVALLLISPRFLASTYIRNHELPALYKHGVRLAPVLVGSCFYNRIGSLASVQWLHDPSREGALNLVAQDQVGERDRRIWQACRKLLDLLPTDRKPATAVAGPSHRSSVVDVPMTAALGLLSRVPPPPPGYVARQELAGLIQLVCAADVGAVGVTNTSMGLHGQGGIGKSVLAAALARDEGVRRRFPDGVFWVTIGERDDILAVQLDLLARLDPTARAPQTPGEAERLLRGALADRRLLLIVDDVWSDAAAHAFRLTGPRGRIVYTSRDKRVLTAVGAQSFPVEVLELRAARALAAAILAAPGNPVPPELLPVEADTAIQEVGRVALAVALLAAAVRGGFTWGEVASQLARDADVFGDHPYANTFKAMQIGIAPLPTELMEALYALAVFPRDIRIPIKTVDLLWAHTRGQTAMQTRADLDRLAAARVLNLSDDYIEFHDLQHDYLLLHAPALARLHGQLLDAHRPLLLERDQWWQLPPDEPYLRDQLVTHLRGAGARRELATTITDPVVLIQRIATASVLVAETDLADAADILPAHPLINWWQTWLPRHTHLLTLPADIRDTQERIRTLTPTFRAWLNVDPELPVSIDTNRLLALTPGLYLEVCWGLAPQSSAQTRVLTGHTGGVRTTAWSPDGTRLATIGYDGEVRVWDPSTGHTTSIPSERIGAVSAVAWSPDGTHMAAIGDDRAVRLWDSTTGYTATITDHSSPVYAVAWSPDGTRLATAGYTDVKLFEPATGHITAISTSHIGRVYAVDWSPDGTHLATAGYNREVRLWNSTTRELAQKLIGHTGPIFTIAWSPDSTRLATASIDGEVRLSSPATDDSTTLVRHSGSVSAVAWSPDGSHLATASSGEVHLWDPATGRRTAALADHTGLVNAIAWSPDSAYLATASYGEVRLWDPATGCTTATLTDHTREVYAAAWSPDGSRLATAGVDGEVRLWDPATAALTDHIRELHAVAWSPDGARLASASDGGEVQLLDSNTGRAVLNLTGHIGAVLGVAWSPRGTRLATAGEDGNVSVWDPLTGHITATFHHHNGAVSAVAWSPDGRMLATIGDDRSARLLDPTSGRTTATFANTADAISAIAWSPDGTHLVTGGDDGAVLLRDAIDGHVTAILPGHTGAVSAVAWSPDSAHLATGGEDGSVQLRDVTRGLTTASLTDTMSAISGVSWSPDAALFGVVGANGSIAVYTTSDWSVLARLRLDSASDLAWYENQFVVIRSGSITKIALTIS